MCAGSLTQGFRDMLDIYILQALADVGELGFLLHRFAIYFFFATTIRSCYAFHFILLQTTGTSTSSSFSWQASWA
jgi:hypothetical protein